MTEIKTFEDLEKEIIKPNICSLCGGCVAVCAINKIDAIEIADDKPKFVKSDQKICVDCGLCYHICPRTSVMLKQLEEGFASKEPIGAYKKLTWCHTNDPEIKDVCQDGGVVTSLVKYLFDTKQIDGAIVNVALSNWESSPLIITSSEQLLKSAGTRYSITSSLEVFQKPRTYSTSSEKIEDVLLSSIFSLMEFSNFDHARFAFIGCPCHIRAIRKMQLMNVRPANTIKYVIGLFCMENFSYVALMKNKIEKQLKIKLNDIKKVNIKKNFIITLKDNSVKEIPLKDLKKEIRSNCLFCPDFSNVYADISVGGISAPPKNSTVIIRTEKGENLFGEALYGGYISEYKDSAEGVSKLKERSKKIIQRMTKTKEDRASENLKRGKASLGV